MLPPSGAPARLEASLHSHSVSVGALTLLWLVLTARQLGAPVRDLAKLLAVGAAIGLPLGLDAHEETHQLVADGGEHLDEAVVALLLVGLLGVPLAVSAEPNALPQVVHGQQVVLPEGVNGGQEAVPGELPEVLAELLLARLRQRKAQQAKLAQEAAMHGQPPQGANGQHHPGGHKH